MRSLSEIIIHCTATDADWRKGSKTSSKVSEVRKWHVEGNGWSDIGYHFLIDRDGTIAKGRPLERTGAHTKGHNTDSIGIALFGGRTSDANDKFADNFTEDQDRALRGLISDMKGKYGQMTISGHNQYAAKACPGFHAPAWFAGAPRSPSAPPVASPSQPHWLVALIKALFGGRS